MFAQETSTVCTHCYSCRLHWSTISSWHERPYHAIPEFTPINPWSSGPVSCWNQAWETRQYDWTMQPATITVCTYSTGFLAPGSAWQALSYLIGISNQQISVIQFNYFLRHVLWSQSDFFWAETTDVSSKRFTIVPLIEASMLIHASHTNSNKLTSCK
jgi:hypothetical protein